MLLPNSTSRDHGPNVAEVCEMLPPRRRDVLTRILRGDSEKQAARALGLSQHTVHDHVQTLYRSFGVESRAELMALFISLPDNAKPTPPPPQSPQAYAGTSGNPGILRVDIVQAREIRTETLTAQTAWFKTIRRAARISLGAAAIVFPLAIAGMLTQMGMFSRIDAGNVADVVDPRVRIFSLVPGSSFVQVGEVQMGQFVDFEVIEGPIVLRVQDYFYTIEEDFRWRVHRPGILEVRPDDGLTDFGLVRVTIHPRGTQPAPRL